MDRKKQLLMEYKNRKPEMGIILFKCLSTEDSFIDISKDTKANINSNQFKLEINKHPNKVLQDLWNHYGKSGFEVKVLEVLPYDEKKVGEDYSKELEEIYNRYMEEIKYVRRIK